MVQWLCIEFEAAQDTEKVDGGWYIGTLTHCTIGTAALCIEFEAQGTEKVDPPEVPIMGL